MNGEPPPQKWRVSLEFECYCDKEPEVQVIITGHYRILFTSDMTRITKEPIKDDYSD